MSVSYGVYLQHVEVNSRDKKEVRSLRVQIKLDNETRGEYPGVWVHLLLNIHEKMTQRPRVIKVLGKGQHSGKGD